MWIYTLRYTHPPLQVWIWNANEWMWDIMEDVMQHADSERRTTDDRNRGASLSSSTFLFSFILAVYEREGGPVDPHPPSSDEISTFHSLNVSAVQQHLVWFGFEVWICFCFGGFFFLFVVVVCVCTCFETTVGINGMDMHCTQYSRACRSQRWV